MMLLSKIHILVFASCETDWRELGCKVGLGIAGQNPADIVEPVG